MKLLFKGQFYPMIPQGLADVIKDMTEKSWRLREAPRSHSKEVSLYLEWIFEKSRVTS